MRSRAPRCFERDVGDVTRTNFDTPYRCAILPVDRDYDPTVSDLFIESWGGFDAICDDLAERIRGSRMVVKGAGHEIQFAGQPLNEALVALWRENPLIKT